MSDTATSDPQIAQLMQDAMAAQNRGDAASAARSLELVLARDPGNPAAANSLGMQALGRSDFVQAERFFERAAAADPAAPALWMNLATARRAQADIEGERAALTRALGIDQRHLMANVRLAELHERIGEKSQALYRWNGVLTIAHAMSERPAALDTLLKHAQAYVAAEREAFANVIEAGLEGVRGEIPDEERKRFDTCMDAAFGRRRIYHNECAGLHFPFLPAEEFFDRAHFSWMAGIEAQTDAIRTELETLVSASLEGFSPYVTMETGTPANKWSRLDNSLDWGAFFFWRHGRRNDEACRRCPRTAAAIEALPLADMPNRAPTAFFSVLRPKTRLPAHTGVTNARAIVHLPLIVPSGCGFRVGGTVREWRVGEAFAFDDTIEHEAWNDSDELRVVLILDVWNPHLTATERRLLSAFFQLAEPGASDGDSVDW